MISYRQMNMLLQTPVVFFIMAIVFITYQLFNSSDTQIEIDAHRVLAIRPDQLRNMHQADPLLWKYIRTFHVFPPSNKPYNLENPDKVGDRSDFISFMSIKNVLKFLNNTRHGIFVDAGAYNGEKHSKTLFLEIHYGWTGLLIESDPMTFPNLKTKHRKAWISDACLSPSSHPKVLEFQHADTNTDTKVSGIQSVKNVAEKRTAFEVQCFPLYSILAAANITSIDYFNLDVEGIELKVLKELPWNKIFTKIFTVDCKVIPEGKEAVKEFMKSKGYQLVDTIGANFMFIHGSILNINKRYSRSLK